MRILIVDDDPASCQVLRAHLGDLLPDAELVVRHSGAEAAKTVIDALAREEGFDLALLDILMPGMDGHQTLTRIREAEEAAGLPPEKRTKAMMVTSMDDEESHMTALFDGLVSAYLVKPANRLELEAKLRALKFLA